MSAAQVGFGLYGALLVDDPGETFTADAEQVLVLSDIHLDDHDALQDPETGGSAGMAFGREGNVLLVNGRVRPQLAARPGALQRWRVVNAAKSRYFDLDAGEGNRFTKIGGDGGLQEFATTDDFLVLAPGERADVLIRLAGDAGASVPVIAQLFDRGYGSVETRAPEELFTVNLAGPAVAPSASLSESGRNELMPVVTRAIAPLSREHATAVNIEFGITQNSNKELHYTMDGKTLGHFPPVPARVGETQIWTIDNVTPWSHPFHLHGFFFQVLDKNGEPVRPLEWKDTVSVPYKSKLSVIVRYDDRPGMWMFHCHVLDHADGGLMGSVALTRAGETLTMPAHRH
jgi:FtsP/CotA-like multicopper oxidase with cupredoxin domain